MVAIFHFLCIFTNTTKTESDIAAFIDKTVSDIDSIYEMLKRKRECTSMADIVVDVELFVTRKENKQSSKARPLGFCVSRK